MTRTHRWHLISEIKEPMKTITLKEFRFNEAEKWSITPDAVYKRMWSGQYPGVKHKRHSRFVIIVDPAFVPTNNRVNLPDSEVSYHTRYMRIWRKRQKAAKP